MLLLHVRPKSLSDVCHSDENAILTVASSSQAAIRLPLFGRELSLVKPLFGLTAIRVPTRMRPVVPVLVSRRQDAEICGQCVDALHGASISGTLRTRQGGRFPGCRVLVPL